MTRTMLTVIGSFLFASVVSAQSFVSDVSESDRREFYRQQYEARVNGAVTRREESSVVANASRRTQRVTPHSSTTVQTGQGSTSEVREVETSGPRGYARRRESLDQHSGYQVVDHVDHAGSEHRSSTYGESTRRTETEVDTRGRRIETEQVRTQGFSHDQSTRTTAAGVHQRTDAVTYAEGSDRVRVEDRYGSRETQRDFSTQESVSAESRVGRDGSFSHTQTTSRQHSESRRTTIQN